MDPEAAPKFAAPVMPVIMGDPELELLLDSGPLGGGAGGRAAAAAAAAAASTLASDGGCCGAVDADAAAEGVESAAMAKLTAS